MYVHADICIHKGPLWILKTAYVVFLLYSTMKFSDILEGPQPDPNSAVGVSEYEQPPHPVLTSGCHQC